MIEAIFIDFYGIFSSIAFRQRFALTEIAKYSSVISNTGRFDYLSIMMILGASLISCSVPIFFASKLLNYVFSFKKTFIAPIITVGIELLIILVFSKFYYSFEKIATRYFGLLFLTFSTLLPCLLIFFTKRREVNEHIVRRDNQSE